MAETNSVKIGIYVVKSSEIRESTNAGTGSINSKKYSERTSGDFIDRKSHQQFIDNIFSVVKDDK
jgi:hypothetical protein